MSPNGVFCPGDSQLATDSHDNTKKNMSPAKPGLWREISVIIREYIITNIEKYV